jgi:hypothetical protein
MKTKYYFVLLIVIKVSFVYSQNTFPKGTYLNFAELKNKTPSQIDTFVIIKRTQFDIAMNGGNDYKVTSSSEKTNGKFIKRNIYAISTGDSLFLNCFILKLQPKYTFAKLDSNMLIFKAGIPLGGNNDIAMSGVMFGAIGGAIGGAQAALKRFLYVMDFVNGKVTLLCKETLTSLLTPYPDLNKKYLREENAENDTILLKYFKDYLRKK